MTAPDRMDLAAFLARIDDTEAARMRVAAARIDELARVGNSMKGIERSYVPWAGAAGLAFLAGLWFFVNPGTVSPAITLGCLGALPLVAAHYAWRVMARTRADQQAHELNVHHFLPHGGLYFPADDGQSACVMRVEPKKLSPERLHGHKITRRDIWW